MQWNSSHLARLPRWTCFCVKQSSHLLSSHSPSPWLSQTFSALRSPWPSLPIVLPHSEQVTSPPGQGNKSHMTWTTSFQPQEQPVSQTRGTFHLCLGGHLFSPFKEPSALIVQYLLHVRLLSFFTDSCPFNLNMLNFTLFMQKISFILLSPSFKKLL